MNKINAVFFSIISSFIYVPFSEAQSLNIDNTKVIEVKSKTGRIWMDRNLGATQVASSNTNSASFGSLYQWGRGSDGHQQRSSVTSSNLSSKYLSTKNSFVLAMNSPNDWLKVQNINLWQGATGINNPCPAGFRLPTALELDEERATWSSQNASGAFASPLKLPMAGYRSNGDGKITDGGYSGDYWTSTTNGNNSSGLYFDVSSAGIDAGGRACGVSIRCIKD